MFACIYHYNSQFYDQESNSYIGIGSFLTIQLLECKVHKIVPLLYSNKPFLKSNSLPMIRCNYVFKDGNKKDNQGLLDITSFTNRMCIGFIA